MKLLVAPFRDMDRWDAKHLMQLDWAWPANKVEKFGAVANRRIEPINKPELQAGSVRLASIHFDGSITLRSSDPQKMRGRLFLAHPGDLVFSKIDIRNGAIGVIPSDLGIVAFSAEYPIYDVASVGRLRAEFVKLLCRTQIFRSKVNALVVGHSGRKQVTPELMEELLVPAPDLEEQDQILGRFRTIITQAHAAEMEAMQLEKDIAPVILDLLGVQARELRSIQRPFVARFRMVDSWAVHKAASAAQGITEELQSTYPIKRLGEPDISTVSYGIQKSPANRPGANARPYLRVANVQADRLDLSEIKMIDVPNEQMESLRLQYGDLLLCEGNSAELVGRPAMWRDELHNCVHQNHIIKVRVNRDLLEPEYVLAFMNTPPVRQYFLGRAKRTTNLASINSTDVREMLLPVPPIEVQNAIVQQVNAVKTDIELLRKEECSLREQADREIEQLF